jgi:hypothetical protein
MSNKGGPHAAYSGGNLALSHEPEGPYPVLIPVPGVLLKVNGQLCEEAVEVRQTDTIEIIPLDEEHPGTWSINMLEKGLEAEVSITPSRGIRRSIPDLAPAARLQLAVTEDVRTFSPLTLDKLMNELRTMGITYGLDLADCARIAASTTEMKMVVARGKAPLPGTDAQLTIHFSTEEKDVRASDDSSAVDFKERFSYNTVTSGVVLAEVTPAVPGIPGTNVRGEPVLPPAVVEIALAAGRGTELRENSVISTRSGRPVLQRQGRTARVEVTEDLVLKGNVDLNTGNIVFTGNVIVSEDVSPGMFVNAGGSVQVGGLVEGATIQATRYVTIRGNVIGSRVHAGAPPMFLRVILPLRAGLDSLVEDLLQNIRILASRLPQDKRHHLGKLLAQLLENRFLDLRKQLETLAAELERLDQDVLHSLNCDPEELKSFLDDIESGDINESRVYSLRSALARLWEALDSYDSSKADLAMRNCINSNIIATGNVTVTGGGCYNSRLEAGGKVSVHGVLRGGELRAGGDVFVKETGSEAGILTVIQVPSSAKVAIQLAHENTTVIRGGHGQKFTSTQTGVVIK